MEKLLGPNWRTSLAGWIKGLLLIVGDLLQAYESGQFTGLNGLALAFAIMFIISGHIQKDGKVTGGSVPQTPEATTRITTEKVYKS